MAIFDRLRMPTFAGATGWLNSDPLGPDDLRGHVVLADFWTFTCINWLRTEPYIRAWAEAYRDDGLIVVGVHTPEFSFEHETPRVQEQVRQRAIDYPVALDNNYDVWRSFSNNYWPALYFVDPEGVVRDHHFGEGRYEESERVVQRMLGVRRDLVQVEGRGMEAEADWANVRSPETYLGSARGERRVGADRLSLNEWSLAGEWTVGAEQVVLDEPGGSIAFRFSARDAHLVLSRRTEEPIPFRVSLNGAEPDASHGLDVNEDGTGVLDEGRLYHLIRQSDIVREHTLEISFLERGAEAYVFTFG